jgi:hypothetical protein
MTSAINPNTISTTFPIEGQDNPSQGFRTNFAAIAGNFTTAYNEITDLQSKALVSTQLGTGVSTPAVNNLLGATISNGLYQLFSGTYYSATNVSGAVNIDLSQGAVQKFILSGNTTFTFSLTGGTTGFPTYPGTTGLYSSAIILIQSTGTAVCSPTFATTAGTISYDNNFPISPSTGTSGFVVGGEGVSSIVVSNAGSGYTSPATISFTGGSPITNAITPVASATYTIVNTGTSSLTPLTNNTTFATSVAVTATSGTGSTVTLTFAQNTQASGITPYTIGQTIVVSGLVPAGYNGVWTVTGGSATTVTYNCTATGNMTSSAGAGIIQGGIGGKGYALGDLVQIAGVSNTTFAVASIANTFVGTVSNSSSSMTVYDFTNIASGMSITTTTAGLIPAGTYIGTVTPGFPGSITLVASNGSTPVVTTGAGTAIFTYNPASGTTVGPIATLTSFPQGTLTSPISLTTSLRNIITVSGGGSGARLAVSCGIGAINVTTPGKGYTSTAPTVVISSNGNHTGTDNAAGTATLTSGTSLQTTKILAWTVNNGSNVYLRYEGQF